MIALALGASLLAASPGWAQFQRYDYVWARRTTGTFTLDGILDEPQWAQAESLIIDIHQIGPIPGSGWKQEAGFPPTDPNHAVFKFLTTADNQLYMAITVRDSSIGGSELFNYFDGVLMNIRRHDDPARPAPPGEHFMSWWVADTTDHNPRAINHPPSMIGRWRTVGSAPTATQLQAWDAGWHVNGKVNSDTTADQSYTFEMRFDLGMNGYNINQAGGDAIEWNASLYDNDWYWPFANPFRWGINRTWVQGPWGSDSWYSDVKILARNDVTTTSGSVPPYGPDLRIPTAGSLPAPTIDGVLNDAIWTTAASTHALEIKWNDDTIRNAYPQTGKWRSGQFQPVVNKEATNNPTGQAYVQDPADCTVRYAFKGTTLYLGLDFNDQVVQYVGDNADRYDGAIITLTDRVKRFTDNNLYSWRMTFQVGPTGQLVARDMLPYLRDTLGAVTCALHLKPNTTVDTTGLDVDEGYQAEFAIDLTKFGYPADLGDHTVYLGVDVLDGDSYTPFTDSYGTRTWWFRQYENEDGPAVAFLDPGFDLATAGVDPVSTLPAKLELLGNFPNPVRNSTSLHFRLPQAAKVDLQVFDPQGRLLSNHAYGLVAPGEAHLNVPQFTSRSGVYLYRLHVADATTGAAMGTLSGKMMVLH
jgi:hypothetical protein